MSRTARLLMPLRSIRARIVASFSAGIALLLLVTSIAFVSGRQVNASFGSYEEAGRTAHMIASGVEQAILLKLAVARFTRTESAQDRTATTAALGDFRDALRAADSSVAGALGDAEGDAEQLGAALAEVSRALVARRDAAGALADASTSIASTAIAMHDRAAGIGMSEGTAAIVRLQSAAELAGIFALRYQASGAPPDLATAESELVRMTATLDGMDLLLADAPRMRRQLEAARTSCARLAAAVAGLRNETERRNTAIARLDTGVERAVAAFEAARVPLDHAQASAETALRSTLQQAERSVVSAASVATLLALGCIVVLVRTCVRPLSSLVVAIRGLAAGHLGMPIPHAGRMDEVGEVARALATLRDGTVRVQVLEAEAARAAKAGDDERRRLAGASANATEVALGGVAQNVGTTADRLLGAADGLSAIASRTSGRAGRVAVESRQSRATAEDVTAAADRLARSVAEVMGKAREAADFAGAVARDTGRTEDAVRSLSSASEGVETATGIIARIAARTKLLALNAAIEAARAGDAGLGFGVVATEVKELSAQTAAATDSIACQMQAVRLATHAAITTINDTQGATSAVDRLIRSVALLAGDQHDTMDGIRQAAGKSVQVAQDVALAMEAVLADASEVAASVESLRGMAGEVSTQGRVLEAALEQVVGDLRSA